MNSLKSRVFCLKWFTSTTQEDLSVLLHKQLDLTSDLTNLPKCPIISFHFFHYDGVIS